MDAEDALREARKVPAPGVPVMEPRLEKILEARHYLNEAEELIRYGTRRS